MWSAHIIENGICPHNRNNTKKGTNIIRKTVNRLGKFIFFLLKGIYIYSQSCVIPCL